MSLQIWVMDLLLGSVEMKAKFSPGTRGNKFSPDVEEVQKNSSDRLRKASAR